MPPRIVPATSADAEAIAALLDDAALPRAGFDRHLGAFLVARADGHLEGCVGLELHGHSALLRSAVVHPGSRGSGLGAALVEAAIATATARGAAELYLLTTTAEAWFPRFGFIRVEREALPAALEASEELQGACPASATCMRLSLAPRAR